MDRGFFYIVVEGHGGRYFIGENDELTLDFGCVLRFAQREAAHEYIGQHKLETKEPKILSKLYDI